MSASEYYAKARENWRVVLLAVFLVFSLVALVPSGATDGPTDLKYGLELDGGTRVRAPMVGVTATDVDYSDTDPVELERNVSAALDLQETDVRARPGAGEFEVFSENVSREEVATALQDAGQDVQPGDVEDRVSQETRASVRDVIRNKISESPQFSGGRVQIVTTPTGDHFLLVEMPGANRSEVVDLLNERGLVEVVAVYPDETENGSTVYRNQTVFTQDGLKVGVADEDEQGNPYVSVTLTSRATQSFTEDMQAFGFDQEGGVRCRFEQNPESPGHCLVVYKDGEYINSFGMRASLSRTIREGNFDGSFRMTTNTTADARDLRIAMAAGALPTDIDVEAGSTRTVAPSRAQIFKQYSMVTGIIAALTVAVVVFIRYGEARVAVPMVGTALSEVLILLGFAAAVGLPLDLAHIAGFIAVIGTGVDDLVIIADEVLNQGDVSTRRVFQNRFRKAFWVIGAAAVTTIIAMSPLTVLSLGDLSGFAIVTIVGVLIGVLVTRPAYGDILRSLMTRQDWA